MEVVDIESEVSGTATIDYDSVFKIEDDAVFKIFKLLGDINEHLRQEILSLLPLTDGNSELLEYWDDVQKFISLLYLYNSPTSDTFLASSSQRNKIPDIWKDASEKWGLNSIMINPKDPWSTSEPSEFRKKTGFNEQFLIDFKPKRDIAKEASEAEEEEEKMETTKSTSATTESTSATTFLLLEIIKKCNDTSNRFTFLDNFLNIIEEMGRVVNMYLLPDTETPSEVTTTSEEEEEEMEEEKEGDKVLVLTDTGYNLTLSPISPYKEEGEVGAEEEYRGEYIEKLRTQRLKDLNKIWKTVDQLLSSKNVLISNHHEKLSNMIGYERWKVLFDVDNLTKIQIIQLVYLIIFAAYLSGVELDLTLGGSKNKTIKKRRTKNTKRKPKKQAKKQNKTKQTRKNKTRKSKK